MKATDFRIGNIVYYNGTNGPDKHVNIIDAEDIKLMAEKKSYLELHEPIEITEVWLLKFGFKTTITNKDSGYKQYGINSKGFDLMFTKQCNLNPECYVCNIGIDILYIHQLQNLYFSLLGYELELKNKIKV